MLRGNDALLLAPTAGGKTEAAVFPILTRMAAQRWDGLSVLYLCPLKALLNNLLPRLEVYGGWAGRRVALWHGDTPASRRKSMLADPPDLLLTTPESLESMLVSSGVDHRRLFAGLRAVDRGRGACLRCRGPGVAPARRPGTAVAYRGPSTAADWTVGDRRKPHAAADLAARIGCWEAHRGRRRTADSSRGNDSRPDRSDESEAATTALPAADADIQLDYVGSVANAAKVIAALYRGEKRLVFCDSKRLVEQLGAQLRELGVTTYLIHASLSLDERRRSELAFAEGRDCVIVSTSALELGLDVGDLDRVIQVNAPLTVAAFLQRLGRSGRRTGTRRNCLFLALGEDELLLAAGLLLAWSRGFVEPVTAPPSPRHITAQQLLALCLQEGQVGEQTWQEWLPLPGLAVDAPQIAAYLVEQGYLDTDGGMLFIGPEAERRFGHRHFMNLMAVFTAPPEFTVLHGRDEIGRIDPSLLADRVEGPRLLLLGGRSWRVTWTDWKRRRCFVEPAEGGGRARWMSNAVGGVSFEIARSMRDVLLGAEVPVPLTQRASGVLAGLRSDGIGRVHTGGLEISRGDDDLRWWTWAGYRVNATLKATLGNVADKTQRVDDLSIRLRADLRPSSWREVVDAVQDRLCLPEVDEKALTGLKFSEALPRHLAVATLAARLADLDHARAVLMESARFEH